MAVGGANLGIGVTNFEAGSTSLSPRSLRLKISVSSFEMENLVFVPTGAEGGGEIGLFLDAGSSNRDLRTESVTLGGDLLASVLAG